MAHNKLTGPIPGALKQLYYHDTEVHYHGNRLSMKRISMNNDDH